LLKTRADCSEDRRKSLKYTVRQPGGQLTPCAQYQTRSGDPNLARRVPHDWGLLVFTMEGVELLVVVSEKDGCEFIQSIPAKTIWPSWWASAGSCEPMVVEKVE
jgi:hypothetical protein